MGEKKLLGIPKLGIVSGKVIAQAVYNALQEWQVENSVCATCFHKTTSNAGRSVEACVMLEHFLGKHLLHFTCGHHILR